MQTYYNDTKKKRSKLNPIIGEIFYLFFFLRRDFPVAGTSCVKKSINLFAIDVNRGTPHKNHVKLW